MFQGTWIILKRTARPKAIGNIYLYSGYECNICNEKFGHIENDLTNYLGIAQTFLGITGAKLPFGFEGRTLKVKSKNFAGYNIVIIAPENIERDPRIPGKTTFRYAKQ